MTVKAVILAHDIPTQADQINFMLSQAWKLKNLCVCQKVGKARYFGRPTSPFTSRITWLTPHWGQMYVSPTMLRQLVSTSQHSWVSFWNTCTVKMLNTIKCCEYAKTQPRPTLSVLWPFCLNVKGNGHTSKRDYSVCEINMSGPRFSASVKYSALDSPASVQWSTLPISQIFLPHWKTLPNNLLSQWSTLFLILLPHWKTLLHILLTHWELCPKLSGLTRKPFPEILLPQWNTLPQIILLHLITLPLIFLLNSKALTLSP